MREMHVKGWATFVTIAGQNHIRVILNTAQVYFHSCARHNTLETEDISYADFIKRNTPTDANNTYTVTVLDTKDILFDPTNAGHREEKLEIIRHGNLKQRKKIQVVENITGDLEIYDPTRHDPLKAWSTTMGAFKQRKRRWGDGCGSGDTQTEKPQKRKKVMGAAAPTDTDIASLDSSFRGDAPAASQKINAWSNLLPYLGLWQGVFPDTADQALLCKQLLEETKKLEG